MSIEEKTNRLSQVKQEKVSNQGTHVKEQRASYIEEYPKS